MHQLRVLSLTFKTMTFSNKGTFWQDTSYRKVRNDCTFDNSRKSHGNVYKVDLP